MTTNKIHFEHLSNATFYNIAEQVNDICGSAQFASVPQYGTAMAAMATAMQHLDTAYLESSKSFNTNDMKAADKTRDNLSSVVRGILNALLYLPETNPTRRKAETALQVFKDFKFDTNDSYTGESAKIDNMTQRFQTMQADLEAMGVWTYWQQVVTYNAEVKQYFATRNAEYADRVKQAMLNARAQYIASYQRTVQTINAMLILSPSAELESVARRLNALYDYCQQYYLGGGSMSEGNTGGGTTDTTGGDTGNPGENTTPGGEGGNGGGTPATGTQYTLTLNVSPNADCGTVSGTGQYAEGTEVTVTATPADGYEFLRWSDNDPNATRTVTVSADTELTAVFAQA